MSDTFIETSSIEQAVFCQLNGLDVTIEYCKVQNECSYFISPARQAQSLVQAYDRRATAPAKRLLQEYERLRNKKKATRRGDYP